MWECFLANVPEIPDQFELQFIPKVQRGWWSTERARFLDTGIDGNFASSCGIENNDTPKFQTSTSDMFRASWLPIADLLRFRHLCLALNQARVVIAFSLHWRITRASCNVDQCKRKSSRKVRKTTPRVFIMIFARLAQPSQIALVTPSSASENLVFHRIFFGPALMMFSLCYDSYFMQIEELSFNLCGWNLERRKFWLRWKLNSLRDEKGVNERRLLIHCYNFIYPLSTLHGLTFSSLQLPFYTVRFRTTGPSTASFTIYRTTKSKLGRLQAKQTALVRVVIAKVAYGNDIKAVFSDN